MHTLLGTRWPGAARYDILTANAVHFDSHRCLRERHRVNVKTVFYALLDPHICAEKPICCLRTGVTVGLGAADEVASGVDIGV